MKKEARRGTAQKKNKEFITKGCLHHLTPNKLKKRTIWAQLVHLTPKKIGKK